MVSGTISPSCRDKGWMRGPGACPRRVKGIRRNIITPPTGSPRHEDKHKAPIQLHILPLSLQDGEIVPDTIPPIRLSKIIRKLRAPFLTPFSNHHQVENLTLIPSRCIATDFPPLKNVDLAEPSLPLRQSHTVREVARAGPRGPGSE